ncbi:hypothetical protein Pla108_33250 [Botrimarina colliarenosi]|uniref:ATPase AAA-type core domain-containing protein n=1 Tax=Botrimarina colliarenosi TaxID=2528001 RepID=A0A5C6A5C8_9BACT|nr:AAA family ATPase [Botrimarina colliarenosi]TWT95182.1 hypothetical protein Pla108_33250 [Botrimarina colliarenosi]
MIASAYYVDSYSCFRNAAIGFDSFTPITVIIGKNNSGKSKLLDFAQELCANTIDTAKHRTNGTATLDEQGLKSIFREGTSGGELGSYEDHWSGHGSKLIGCKVQWQSDTAGKIDITVPQDYHHGNKNIQMAREKYIAGALRRATTPLSNKTFRRILADRDIRAEPASYETNISADGTGSTNTIRRILTSSELDESLVRSTLLNGMQTVFGSDADFTRIEIKQHDGEDGDTKLREVFFEEPGKGLVPLGQSGSGLKTVLLVLLNLLVIPTVEKRDPSKYVFALEELENNLHPSLLRRLFDFITDFVSQQKCSLLITTHSSVALDYFGTCNDAQIIRVFHDGSSATASRVLAHFDRVGLIAELGAKPSDLLQANGVIWVEGPSDRIYINRMIELYSDGELREGRDYQCAYYGGSLLARVEFCDPESESAELSNLLRLNNHVAIICDGDRTASSGRRSRIKPRVEKIKEQLATIPNSYIWITDAKEIECYIPSQVWNTIYKKKGLPDPRVHDSFPDGPSGDDHYVFREISKTSFNKFDFSLKSAPKLTKELLEGKFDIEAAMNDLIKCIRKWNE